MGVEHNLQLDLMLMVRGKPTAPLPMPPFGFVGPTPNQKLLHVVVWLLQAWFAHDKVLQAAAMARTREFFKALTGHFAVGNAEVETLCADHSQLWYSGWAGLLWAARLYGGDFGTWLEAKVIAIWRAETAMTRQCTYTGEGDSPYKGANGKLVVLTPGARAGKPNAPSLIGSNRDKVTAALLNGPSHWNEPHYNVDSGYDASIPLLSAAFGKGVKPSTLVGDVSEVPPSVGFHCERTDAGFYAWLDHLTPALQPLYGAGRLDGEIVLEWDQTGAIERGERMREAT